MYKRQDSSLIPSKGVNCISAGSKLYVGTKSGLAVYDPNSEAWTSFTEREGLPDDWILSVCPEGEVIWLGTMRGGLVRLDMARGEIRSWRVADGLLSNTVFSVSASDRYVFAGTTRGLSILDRETLQIVSYGQDNLPSPSVYSVLWVDETGSAWIGTGTGLAFWNAENGSITHLTKLGEIELGKVTSIVKVAGSVWITRPSTLWLRHRTSGAISYDLVQRRWVRPVYVDVLVDQVGYAPGFEKGFIVQSNLPFAGGRFEVVSAAGRICYAGSLSPRVDREDWDAYYWIGDFSDLRLRGNFSVVVYLDLDQSDESSGSSVVARSPRFEIDGDVLLDSCGDLVYQFLRYMRCGAENEFRSRPCHLDDGVLPNGTHRDATGGWHCAGLWDGKWSEYHTYVLFNIALAYDFQPEFYSSIDRDANGLPDILDEAVWGCDFLCKMQVSNGSIFHEVENVHITDGIVGTADDRKIMGWVDPIRGLLAAAGWAYTASMVSDIYPTRAARYLDSALRSLAFYEPRAKSSTQMAALMLAYAQLYRATGNSTYLRLAELYCNTTMNLPYSTYRGPFIPVALGYYLLKIDPQTELRGRIVDYVQDYVDSRIRAYTGPSGELYPFEVPTFHLYLMDPDAAASLMAYRLTGNQTYRGWGLRLVDCHLGVNPYGICMLEGAGTINPPGYASNLRSPSNPRGAAPGSIPQGIQMIRGRPYFDLSISPGWQTGETWLINTNFLQPICLLPVDNGTYPVEVGENLWEYIGILLGLLVGLVPASQGQADTDDTDI